MKNIIIFGASGFIGKAFVDNLITKGFIPTIVSPDNTVFTDNKYDSYQKIEVDFSTINSLEDLLKSEEYYAFVYLAWSGYGSATNDYKMQIQNIKPVCDAIVQAKKIGCNRFVFASSFSEFMISENELKTHNTGASANVYGSVKNAARIIAHSVAKQHDIKFISVAFANTFGPGDYSQRTPNKFISSFLSDKEVNLTTGEHLYDWNFIEDTIDGLYLATMKGIKDELYYIGNRIQKPLKEIVFDIKEILNSNSQINLGLYQENYYLDYSSIDIHKLYRHTGYLAKTSFKDAIIRTADWVRDNKL